MKHATGMAFDSPVAVIFIPRIASDPQPCPPPRRTPAQSPSPCHTPLARPRHPQTRPSCPPCPSVPTLHDARADRDGRVTGPAVPAPGHGGRSGLRSAKSLIAASRHRSWTHRACMSAYPISPYPKGSLSRPSSLPILLSVSWNELRWRGARRWLRRS
jgi:hypothetical protein